MKVKISVRSTQIHSQPCFIAPRPDARLTIDPGILLKAVRSRIEVGISAQLIAEGTEEKPIVFTSRNDDRFGASGTFDTNNDGLSSGAAGDWSALLLATSLP